MAPWWLCLALVLVCLSVHTSPQLSHRPALIRVFILPWVCQQARRDAATDPSCAFPSRMPMADKSPTSPEECKPLAFTPVLYIVHPFSLLNVHFLVLFSFLLKQKRQSRPLIMICLSWFLFSLFLVLFVGCSDWAKSGICLPWISSSKTASPRSFYWNS